MAVAVVLYVVVKGDVVVSIVVADHIILSLKVDATIVVIVVSDVDVVIVVNFLVVLFSLGLGQNQSFGPKQNTKVTFNTTTTTHHPPPTHPPKTFWRVLGMVGGQDLVYRLLIA